MKYILIVLVLAGCYSERRAMQQFSRAVAFDPAIPAEFCARQFPPRDTVVHDTTVVTDTLEVEGTTQTDTITVNDTVRITRTVQLPGQTVTRTVTIRDTIRVTNTAALDACRIEVTKLVTVITPITSDRDKYKKRSRTYFWIILACGAIIGVGAYSKLRGIFTPKLRSV